MAQDWCSGSTKITKLPTAGSEQSIWYRTGVPGTRKTRSGLQLAPGIQNVAWEWCSGNTKNT
eukprot:7872428-Pyramimonas_sp.AAC.1